MPPTTPTYDPVLKGLHWLTLGLMVAVFALSTAIDRVPDADKAFVTQLHRSVGLTIWAVTVVRFIWRQRAVLPAWPASLRPVAQFITKTSEYALYILLLVQPLLGVAHSNTHGDPVTLFFLVDIPAIVGRNQALSHTLHELHGASANALLVLIGLHAVAGLFRHFHQRDGALVAMLPTQGNA